MASSDSEHDLLEELEEELDEDNDQDVEDDLLDAVGEDATEDGEDDTASEDSPDEDTDDDDDESDRSVDPDETIPPPDPDLLNALESRISSRSASQVVESKSPSPPPALAVAQKSRKRSISPAQARRNKLVFSWDVHSSAPPSFTVEAICAIPHPVPTHALAASYCMTHLLTGSDDGYIRDYDIFSAVNGKAFLTAPQRHHSGVVEGIMKAGQLRFWWENPLIQEPTKPPEEGTPLSPVYSLACHSDALWTLAGTDTGRINLFTVRHEPGRLFHVLQAHRGPVSGLSLDHDEKSVFSAGWDGEAKQWDLNTGQNVRKFTAHGAQLTAIAVRPQNAIQQHNSLQTDVPMEDARQPMHYPNDKLMAVGLSATPAQETLASSDPYGQTDTDARSDVSFDPLFDDEPEEDSKPSGLAIPNAPQGKLTRSLHRESLSSVAPPKGAPPLLDPASYSTFSPDILLTASIDGQVMLWDKRTRSSEQGGVGRLWMNEKTPPWCLSACWSADGGQIYAGRRNGTVDVWDVRQLGRSGPANTPHLLKTIRNPLSSGVVSCVIAFPDNKHIACASIDNIRLWNAAEAEPEAKGRGAQFRIVPGHHGGYISQMIVDPGARFLVSASSNRGWHGDSTRTVFVHDIKHVH